jgi:hypothetical protein
VTLAALVMKADEADIVLTTSAALSLKTLEVSVQQSPDAPQQ